MVTPLQHLVDASQRVQQRDFSHPQLDVALPNELGVLSQTFSAMSDELARLYQSLELKVQERPGACSRPTKRWRCCIAVRRR